jgi:hypothetical protein
MSLSARTGRARRTRRARARVRVQIRGDEAADESHKKWARARPNVSRKERRLCDPDPAGDHRAFQAGAVLSLVNALRFASTRPAAGPSGIDDACARHDVGYCAMAGFLMTWAGREKRVDAGFPQAYVDVSRLCPTAHPPHRTSACRARFQSSPSGHDSSAPPQHRVRLLRRHATRESAHLTRDQPDSLRRVVSKTKRR